MATAYSNEVVVGPYNRIRLRVEYSDTSASCHIEFRRTSTWTDSWSDSAASITFNGQTVSSPYSYSGTVDTNWREIASASGFSIPISGGTFSWSFNNPSSYAVLGCSGDITIGSQVVAPSVPTLSIVSVTNNSIEVSYGTASFGTPASGTVYLYGGTATAPTVQIASSTTTGQSTFVWTGLTSSTTYYLRSNATNGSATSAYSTEVTATTTASTPALYGSVSGQTKKVKKLYGAVNGQTKLIKKLYGSENGVTKLVYEA